MALAFKKGDKVSQKVFVIEGEVTNVQVVDGDHLQFAVAYTGEDGEQHETWFREDQLVAKPADTPAA